MVHAVDVCASTMITHSQPDLLTVALAELSRNKSCITSMVWCHHGYSGVGLSPLTLWLVLGQLL